MTRHRIAQIGENRNPKSPENRPQTRRFLQIRLLQLRRSATPFNGLAVLHGRLSRSDWRPHSDTWLATARLRAEYRVSCRPDRNGIGAVASARSLWITGSTDRSRSLRAAFGLASAARRHPLGRERLHVCLDAAFFHDVVVAGAESLRARREGDVFRFLAGKRDLAQAPMEIGRHHIAVLRCDPDNIADPNGSPFICNRPLATATRKIVYRLHSLTEGLYIASRQLTYVGHQPSSPARIGAACTNAVNIWLLPDFGLPRQFRDTTKALARNYDVDPIADLQNWPAVAKRNLPNQLRMSCPNRAS